MDCKKIVAMAPYETGWRNVELIKDCGIIPYLLYKNHGCKVIMVGAQSDNYTYLEKYVKGLEMEFLPNGTQGEKLKYIQKNAHSIDALILRGCYSTNFAVAKLYKEINKFGKIYVGLDANSHWMDRIISTDSMFVEFMDNCDVIAASSTVMQRHLNEKWNWPIEFIPNGYYDFTQIKNDIDFEKKENTIVTVGRIGTQQKANHILMEAFAIVASEIPSWTLKLVGAVEESFKKYVESFFERNPQLINRVIFEGSVEERQKLKNIYASAKIFALSSTFEGTPNVVAEALNAGCVMAVTEIDAYEDIINFGLCGKSAAVNDIIGFSKTLLELANCKHLKQLSTNALIYGKEKFDMEKIVKKLSYMIFEEEI